MFKKIKSITLMLLALVLIAAASGCAKPQPAGLTEDQVRAVLTNILASLGDDNYEGFKQDLSDAMIDVFTQEQFTQLRDLLQTASGNFLSAGTPTLLNQQGYAVYRFPCQFDQEDVIVTITFPISGTQVDGLFLDSTNLRSASQ